MFTFGRKRLPLEVRQRINKDPLVIGALNQANCTDGGVPLDLPSKQQTVNLVLRSLRTQGETSPFFSYKDYYLNDVGDALHQLWKTHMRVRKRVEDNPQGDVVVYFTEFKRHMVPPPLGRNREGKFIAGGPAGPGRGHTAASLRMPSATTTPTWQTSE
jgi:hypothetical protein